MTNSQPSLPGMHDPANSYTVTATSHRANDNGRTAMRGDYTIEGDGARWQQHCEFGPGTEGGAAYLTVLTAVRALAARFGTNGLRVNIATDSPMVADLAADDDTTVVWRDQLLEMLEMFQGWDMVTIPVT